MYIFILCVPVWLYALNVAGQTAKTAKTQANCTVGSSEEWCRWRPNRASACPIPQPLKKGGIDPFLAYLMGACWRVCTCMHVLICTHVSEMHGARTRRKHMFLADRAGSSERSSTAAQRKQKRN